VIVTDASAIVELLVAEDGARGRIEDVLREGASLEAPDVITLEVLSALTGLARRGRLQRSDRDAMIASYLELPITQHLTHPFVHRIAALAVRHSVYDAAYVALAEAFDAPLLTTDARLARAATTVDVIHPA
jgi:predicted nucleic acid-binding protein